jgi:hypothetical protein
MKFVYVVQGFGEFALAESFALYAEKQNHENIFITDNTQIQRGLCELDFTVYLSKTPEQAQNFIHQLQPDVLFYCSSKTTHMYDWSLMKQLLLAPKPFSACFDANWLWLEDGISPFRSPDWLDLIFVVMPQPIFQQGLHENGGHYKIAKVFRDKIYTPGFIPSGCHVSAARKQKVRERLGIRDEKLIFSYFGAREKFILERYVTSLERIAPALNLKVFIKLANHQQLPHYDWLITKDWLPREEMVEYIASSDLVIQHHGLGTLPKVIRSQVPVICITEEVNGDYPYYKHSPYFEIEAFRRLNLCHGIHTYDFSPELLQEQSEALLFDERAIRKMKHAQKRYFEAGEEKAYMRLMHELSLRNNVPQTSRLHYVCPDEHHSPPGRGKGWVLKRDV